MTKALHSTLLLIFIFLFATCKKTESPGDESSKIISLSNSLVVELVSIIPSDDGGFVIGAKTWKNENEDFWILKFDQNFKLQWERVVGGEHNETLQKLVVDDQNRVFAAGVSNGYGQESRPVAVDKNEVFYFHFFDENGKTIWEKAYPYSNWNFSSFDDRQEVTDLLVTKNGDFLMLGHKWHSAVSSSGGGVTPSLAPILIEISKSGQFQKDYISSSSTYPWLHWSSLFETTNNYTIFWQKFSKAGFIEIDKQDPGGFESYDKQMLTTNWNWTNQDPVLGLIGVEKLNLNASEYSQNYFFNDYVYRYAYDANLKTISESNLPLNLKNINSVSTTLDQHFLLTGLDGGFYETDSDFKILNSFQAVKPIRKACKLISGEYVLGLKFGHSINLIHYSKNGEIK